MQRRSLKAAVLGAGNIGSVVATDFAVSLPSWEVTSADLSLERAKRVSAGYGGNNLSAAALDVGRFEDLVTFLKGFDLVISALPGSVGFNAARASVEAGRNLIDVSFSPEDPFVLGDAAMEKAVVVIPDCGVAPGLSNALVGHGVSQLQSVEKIHVMVGGLPVDRSLPLGYVVTWSVEGLIDEYTRKARIIEDGASKEVEALSGVETIEFPGVGTLEAFFTDGARTLFRTVGPVREMWEKTMRYPGHVEAMRSLKELGCFDDSPVDLDGVRVIPRELTARLLEGRLRVPAAADLLAMKVDVYGRRDGAESNLSYTLLDYCDKAHGISAMARTTAFTASIVAQMVAQGEIEGKGILTPEEIGMKDVAFEDLLRRLRSRGVMIS